MVLFLQSKDSTLHTFAYAQRKPIGLAGYRATNSTWNAWAKSLLKKFLTTDPKPVILIPMMNDLFDMIQVSCEENVTAADEAQAEHARGERERERAEVWATLEAEFGPLHFRNGRFEYADYEGMAWKD